MANRYSHALVLSYYESRGLITLPHESTPSNACPPSSESKRESSNGAAIWPPTINALPPTGRPSPSTPPLRPSTPVSSQPWRLSHRATPSVITEIYAPQASPSQLSSIMSDNSVTSFIPHAGHTPRTSVPGSRTSPQPVYGEHTDGEADGHRSKKQGDGAGDERIRCSPRPGSVSVGGDGEASHLDVKKRKDSHGQKSIRRCIVQSHDASQPWEVDDDGLNIDQRHHAIPHGDEPNRFFKIGDSLSKQPLAESEDPWVIESSNSDDIELPEPEIDPCHDDFFDLSEPLVYDSRQDPFFSAAIFTSRPWEAGLGPPQLSSHHQPSYPPPRSRSSSPDEAAPPPISRHKSVVSSTAHKPAKSSMAFLGSRSKRNSVSNPATSQKTRSY